MIRLKISTSPNVQPNPTPLLYANPQPVHPLTAHHTPLIEQFPLKVQVR
jgi:hypothetical protein